MSVQDIPVALSRPPPLRLREAALFLDLDGTLAPIAARPQDVRPDPRRTSLLERLAGPLDGRLAVVSGRTLADVDRILEGCVTTVAAVHGLVRRGPDLKIFETPAHPDLPLAVGAFQAFATRDSGLIVEEKAGLSVALHFRLAAGCGAAARDCARAVAATTGLTQQDGDMVEELRTPGATKGDSVRAFMASPPFAGARPVFVGDDATDEDGFAAAQALDGIGICVGPSRHPTLARFRLDGVDAALAWLEAAL
jgi:trehalose 6-phosphate phosphatase